ncbi:MAG: GNAT family N-acetyltransferase [Roseobacter sp.]
MTGTITLNPITLAEHSADALDLATRAADYVTLEVGYAPDDAYVEDFFTATPPNLGADCLLHYGVMQGPAMVGMICIAKGYEYPDDWWIGLMLFDPAFRNRCIGRRVVDMVKERAKLRKINMIRLAVLMANPRALKFWHREGFIHHRDAPATASSDGNDRVVLKYQV